MTYKVNEILGNEDAYQSLIDKLFVDIEADFQSRRNKVTIDINGEKSELSLANLLTNLIVWKPFVTFKEELTPEYILDCSNLNADILNDYIEGLRVKFFKAETKYELNIALAEIIEGYAKLTFVFNKYIGNSISLYSFHKLAEANKDYKEIVQTELHPDKSSKEMEDELAEKTKILIEILKNEPNCFQDYMLCKEGININQLTQFMIAVGPKPDLNGNVYPVPVRRSIMRGFNEMSDYYIDATGGRKALITNFIQVKKSGYISRKLTLLCMNTLLDYEQEDCGTTDYVEIELTKDSFRRLNGRWILDEKTGKEFMLSNLTDNHLIGKTVKLRSPITCKGHNGKICRKCYGHLSDLNNDIHIGKFGVDVLGSQLTQMLLSTKHLLKTLSEEINWHKIIKEYFRFDGNAILLGKEYDTKESLIFNIDSIFNEDDEDQPIKEFILKKDVKGVPTERLVKLEKELWLSEYFIQMIKTKADINDEERTAEIKLKDLNVEEVLFYFIINNSEMISHLNNLIDLIENKDHLGITTKNGMLNKFAELLANSNIKIDMVHVENIIRELLRDVNNLTKRQYHEGEYTILRLTDAIMNSPSVINSFSFEQIKKQLLNPNTYKKNESSYLDVLFK